MKRFTISCFFIGLLSASFSQTNINTWYVIPPTSGCNGVWAIDYTQWVLCQGGGPAQYSAAPLGCIPYTGWTYAGDTTFIPLCSLPCNLTIIDGDGNVCGCGAGTFGIKEDSSSTIPDINIFPNPVSAKNYLTIDLNSKLQDVSFEIYNQEGKNVFEQTFQNPAEEIKIDVSEFAAGNYAIVVSNCKNWSTVGQFIITH